MVTWCMSLNCCAMIQAFKTGYFMPVLVICISSWKLHKEDCGKYESESGKQTRRFHPVCFYLVLCFLYALWIYISSLMIQLICEPNAKWMVNIEVVKGVAFDLLCNKMNWEGERQVLNSCRCSFKTNLAFIATFRFSVFSLVCKHWSCVLVSIGKDEKVIHLLIFWSPHVLLWENGF